MKCARDAGPLQQGLLQRRPLGADSSLKQMRCRDVQGFPDYALASAGGHIVGHSKLAGPLPLWYRAWRVLAPTFGGPHPLLPHLDKVLCHGMLQLCYHTNKSLHRHRSESKKRLAAVREKQVDPI